MPFVKTPIGDKEFITLMAFLMSVLAISIDAMLPALGIIGGDFGVTNPNHPQYVIAMIFLGIGIGELFWGPMSDIMGRKRVLYIGILFYLGGALICYFADSFAALLVGRLIQGIGGAAPYVTSVSIVRDKFAGRQMARVMSVIMMIFLLVPAVAPAFGQIILHFGSWRWIFLMYVIYGAIITLWLFFRMEETLPKEKRLHFDARSIYSAFVEALTHRITFWYTVCMGICFGSFMGYLNSAQQIFHVQFGTGDMFAAYFAGLALTMGAASLVNSRLVEKYGMRYLCLRSFAFVVLSSAIFLALHIMVPITLWMFLGYAAILFFCFGLVFGNLNALAMEPMGHIAGVAAAMMGAVSSVISMVLGTVIGQLYNNTLIPMTAGFLILSAIAIAIILWADKREEAEIHTDAGAGH